MARKLKVFQAQFGFYDTVVAAPSQAAALKAWGTRQNLFASGEAQVTTDAAAVAAATANPETVLRRAVGSKDAFAVEPSSLPSVPDAPKRAKAPPAAKEKPTRPEPPPADRTALDEAEAGLRAVDDARKREEADFRRQQEELDQAKAGAQAAYVEARKGATAKVVGARKDYRAAGGRD
jgi:hypothetical protein